MSAPPRRPILRYQGGKWMLARQIVSHFPPHRVYCEPYCGAASVLLRKPRCYAEIINDLYRDVYQMFCVLRDPEQAAQLVKLLELTPYHRDEFVAAGERVEDPIENTRRLIVRSYMGFGSDSVFGNVRGFRINCFRMGSTPASDWANYPASLASVVNRLRGVGIENKPALEVIADADSPETLFYVDPPYVHSTRSQGNLYDKKHFYAHEMTDDQHVELAAALNRLRGKVVLSGYPSGLYDGLYEDWHRVEIQSHADGARDRTECLWMNFEPGRQLAFDLHDDATKGKN